MHTWWYEWVCIVAICTLVQSVLTGILVRKYCYRMCLQMMLWTALYAGVQLLTCVLYFECSCLLCECGWMQTTIGGVAVSDYVSGVISAGCMLMTLTYALYLIVNTIRLRATTEWQRLRFEGAVRIVACVTAGAMTVTVFIVMLPFWAGHLYAWLGLYQR